MTLKSISQYLGKCNKELKELSRRDSKAKLWKMYIDYPFCAMRYGCLIRQYVYGNFYQMDSCQRRDSMTYRRILQSFDLCNKPNYIHLLNNKAHFNRHFNKWVKRKWLYSKEMSWDSFCDFANENEEAIVKPLDACEGVGVSLIKMSQEERRLQSLYGKLKSSDFLIEEKIIQHPEMVFQGRSVNTIRMHSVLDKNGNVHCFKPMLRVGVGDAVIDNYCAGGCVYEVDVETGKVISPSLSKDHKRHTVHPGTNISMIGYQVPLWQEVISQVQEAAKAIPECRFIGWDVAITATGIELIEGNHNPDYELLEFEGTRGWWGKLKQYII